MKETEDFISPYVKRMHGEISLEEFYAAEASTNATVEQTLIAIGPIVLTENHWSKITQSVTEAYGAVTQRIKTGNNEPPSNGK